VITSERISRQPANSRWDRKAGIDIHVMKQRGSGDSITRAGCEWAVGSRQWQSVVGSRQARVRIAHRKTIGGQCPPHDFGEVSIL
jgi:hypothetical protein